MPCDARSLFTQAHWTRIEAYLQKHGYGNVRLEEMHELTEQVWRPIHFDGLPDSLSLTTINLVAARQKFRTLISLTFLEYNS